MRQKIEEVKAKPFAQSHNKEYELEMQQKDRFGDPLKLMKSSTYTSAKTQLAYRVLQT